MAELQLPKLIARVRFPSSAPRESRHHGMMCTMARKKNAPAREPLSNTSVVLFILLFAANVLALVPAVSRSASFDQSDPLPFIAPGVLYAAIIAAASLSLARQQPRRMRWLWWVGLPSVALALCVLSMLVLWFSIPLAIYAGVFLLAQVIVAAPYGYTGRDNPLA